MGAIVTWDPKRAMAYECMSFLPDLTDAQIAKQVDYMIGNGWTPCVELGPRQGHRQDRHHPRPRLLPQPLLEHVEAAPLRLHRRDPGHLRDQGMPPDLPRRHRPRDRLRPPAPGAGRRVHRPEVRPLRCAGCRSSAATDSLSYFVTPGKR